MYKAVYAYAWDLADEPEAIDRIRATGANTVAVAASYHAGKFLRPHGRSARVYFPEDGTVYFRPRMERYGAIRPIRAGLVDEHDVFDRLARTAPDLDRVAWTVLLHNTPLGRRHPDLVTRNAFGDPYLYSLSPANEAVREYCVTLCADLADRHELWSLALETPGWLPYAHGFHHEFQMVPLNRWASTLLALDFSDAAVAAAEAAGIDATRLKTRTREALAWFLDSDLAVPEERAMEWWLADVIGDPEWVAFLRWRCRLVADLVRDIKAALPAATRLAVIPTVNRPTAACWLEGSDLAMLADAADILEVPVYEPSAAAAVLDVVDARRRMGEGAALHALLRPDHPDLAGGAETAAAVRLLAAEGVDGFAFYNYGHIRLPALERVRVALAGLDP
jgi:hypothetical protein